MQVCVARDIFVVKHGGTLEIYDVHLSLSKSKPQVEIFDRSMKQTKIAEFF